MIAVCTVYRTQQNAKKNKKTYSEITVAKGETKIQKCKIQKTKKAKRNDDKNKNNKTQLDTRLFCVSERALA